MKKIFIIGISGTGKSEIGRKIAERTNITLHHMDAIIWSPNWTETTSDLICTALTKITAAEKWIVEGWVDVYSKDILQQCDVVLYLDYPGWLAACGGLQRWWMYKGKMRPEMPEGCIESFDLRFLHKMLLRKERPHIEAMLEKVPQLNIIRVRSRREAEKVLLEIIPQLNK